MPGIYYHCTVNRDIYTISYNYQSATRKNCKVSQDWPWIAIISKVFHQAFFVVPRTFPNLQLPIIDAPGGFDILWSKEWMRWHHRSVKLYLLCRHRTINRVFTCYSLYDTCRTRTLHTHAEKNALKNRSLLFVKIIEHSKLWSSTTWLFKESVASPIACFHKDHGRNR